MRRYPLDKFPKVLLKPEVVARHEEHLRVLANDIEKYSTVGHRDQSMYDWLLLVFENLGLSTVSQQYLDSLAVTKTRMSMFVVLIDDPVDNVDKRNIRLSEELLKVPFESGHINSAQLDSKEFAYLEFTKELWTKIISEVKNYPNYKQYEEAFKFDVKQLLNSMEYSRFVNTIPYTTNQIENETYVHHSMIVLIQTDLDLMCSKSFDQQEFGKLREFLYVSQRMAKIGNLFGTYTREFIERDMSSNALLRPQNREDLEKVLMKEWQREYKLAKVLSGRIKSVDMNRFMSGLEFVQKAYQMKKDYW